MHNRCSVCLSVLASLVVCGPTAVRADGEGSGPKVKVSGFISTSVFVQDRGFKPGNGQNALWAQPGRRGEDPWLADADVRNTRLRLTIDVPQDENLAFRGHVEADFFGGFPGQGFVHDEMPIPRLRLAYADIVWHRTTIRAGQYWNPLFGNVPVSVTHIAFPVGYASAGMIGWRFPGIFLYQDLTPTDSGVGIELQLAVFRGSWDGPGSNVNSLSAGNASMVPQIEARLNLEARDKEAALFWQTYFVGHYDRKDTSGVGDQVDGDSLDGYAAEVGFRLRYSRVSLHGNAYWGKAVGQQVAHILQIGDITGWGGWAQAGVQISDNLDIHAFYGIDDPDDDDVLAAFPDADAQPRLRNQSIAVMLRYTAGPYQVGVEWLHGELLHSRTRGTAVGNQFSASALFSF